MTPLRTVLVGHGKIGGGYADDPVMARHYEFATHAQALEAHPAFAWDAVVDPSELALATARERWGVTHTARTIEELRERYEPEVAVIATPPDERLAIVEALPALRGVLVEKPLGDTFATAERFAAACADRRLPAQVNLWRRADETFRELAAGRLEELIGRPQAVFGVYGNGLLNNGTHMVDFVRMLVGEVEQVHAFGPPQRPDGLVGDLQLPIVLRLAGGVTATLQPLAFSSFRENGLDIWGERGRLSILQEGLGIQLYPRVENRAMQGELEIASDQPQPIPSTVGRALYRVYDNLAEAIAGRAELWSPTSSALATAAVMHEILGEHFEHGRVRETPSGPQRIAEDRMTEGADVLVFVEDPGAANYVSDLAPALAARGRRAVLVAEGPAREYLTERGVPWRPLAGAPEPLLAKAQPRLVVVGTSENPDTAGLALVTAARAAGLDSVGVVDALPNAEHRFRGRASSALAHAPDWLLVPDEATRAAYVTLGYPAERALVCGHPRDDAVLALAARLDREDRASIRARVLPAAPAGARVVVFLAEISDGFEPGQFRRSPEYTLGGRGGPDGRTEIVLEELLDALPQGAARPYVVLRLHPKSEERDYAPYVGEIDRVSSGGSPYELVYAADLVVGMTTALLGEAVLLGRPTLAVLPRQAERAWLPAVCAGVTRCVTTREELREALPALLERPPLRGATPPSGALDRVVDFLEARLARIPQARDAAAD